MGRAAGFYGGWMGMAAESLREGQAEEVKGARETDERGGGEVGRMAAAAARVFSSCCHHWSKHSRIEPIFVFVFILPERRSRFHSFLNKNVTVFNSRCVQPPLCEGQAP